MKSRLLTLPLLAFHALAWTHADADSFKESLRENDVTLVAFVHPTDEKSLSLESEWTALSTQDPITITSIDCSAAPNLCTNLTVSSFPTIRLYHRSGRVDRYRGPRRAFSIGSFVRRMLRPSVSVVNEGNSTAFFSTDDVVFIGHFSGSDGSSEKIREQFTKMAGKYRDRYSFAVSAEGDGDEARVDCYNMPDEIQRSLPAGEINSPSALERFVKTCATPLVPELTRRNEMVYYQSGKSLVHYLYLIPSDRFSYISQIRPLAKKYAEYLHFITTDLSEYPDAPGMLGLPAGTTRGLSVQNPSNGDVFPYTERQAASITAEVVEAFLVDIIQGRVKPWRGEQGVPSHEEL